MEIKYTLQGVLIYLAMAAYLFAFFAALSGKKKFGQVFYFAGFIAAAVAFIYRWYHVSHVPFQNLFEVLLSMGMLVYPLSVFCRRVLGVETGAADMLIGVLILFPCGFVFHAEPQRLPPALQSPLFIPHVAVYLLAYLVMAKAAVEAFCQLKNKAAAGENVADYEENTYKMICLGFPLLTLGLILGSWWGKLAWGDYWGWDPKELWSLASWLVYVGYFHFRWIFGKKRPSISSGLAILGIVVILITLFWVNLSRLFPGLHSYA